jgi:anti-sigma factor RsiW
MSKSNHLIKPEELVAYLDGELSHDQAVTAAKHLEHCRECQAIAADVQSVSRQMMAWEVELSESPSMATVASALEQRTVDQSDQLSGRSWYTIARLRPWILAACLLLLLVLAIPSFRQRGMPVDMVRTTRPFAAQMALPNPQAGESMAELPASKARLPKASTKPMIVRTAQLFLLTTGFDRVRDRVSEILKRHQGYIGELNINSPAGVARTLQATLRVPADRLEAATAELRSLGRVESESQGGEEVTEQFVDLEARLTNARNTEQRLTDLLRQRTGRLSDVLAVEKEIDEVRGSIERMTAEKKSLGNRVDFANLTLRVTEDYRAQMQVVPPSVLTRFQNAAVEGYRSMVEGVVSLLLILISYGPSFLIWGALLFFPVRAAWRRLRSPVP